MRGVVVADEVEMLVLRRPAVDQAQEPEPLLMTVVIHAGGHHGAVEGIQRGEQRGRAVTLVSWVMVWARPFFIGSPGWVRLRA